MSTYLASPAAFLTAKEYANGWETHSPAPLEKLRYRPHSHVVSQGLRALKERLLWRMF